MECRAAFKVLNTIYDAVTDAVPSRAKLRISAPLLEEHEEQQLPGAMTDEFFMYKYKTLEL